MKKINIYSTKNINIISLIISLIILLSINFINFTKIKILENNNEKIISEKISKNKIKDNEKNTEKKPDWYVEIPDINLLAPINESTEMNILNKYVGHFEETSLKNGNIGLAGHNRGYEKNYFEKINKLEEGKEIKYKYYDFEKTYIVETKKVIKKTDWSYLEATKENKLTLITCVNDKPEYRLCIQAIEK